MEEKRKKRKERWEHKTAIAKFFTFPLGTPLTIKILAFLFALCGVGGLVIFVSTILLFVTKEMGVFILGSIYGFLLLLLGVIFFYGIGHLKRWAFYSYGSLLIFILIFTFLRESFSAAISASIVPAVVFLILWAYREKFFTK
jgi:hypothetical protein